MWHVSSRSGAATLQTAIHLLLTYLLTYVVLAVALCLSVRPSVTSRYYIETTGWIERVFDAEASSTYPV